MKLKTAAIVFVTSAAFGSTLVGVGVHLVKDKQLRKILHNVLVIREEKGAADCKTANACTVVVEYTDESGAKVQKTLTNTAPMSKTPKAGDRIDLYYTDINSPSLTQLPEDGAAFGYVMMIAAGALLLIVAVIFIFVMKSAHSAEKEAKKAAGNGNIQPTIVTPPLQG